MAQTAAGGLRPRKGQGRVDELTLDGRIFSAVRLTLRTIIERNPGLGGQEAGLVETLLDVVDKRFSEALVEAQLAVDATKASGSTHGETQDTRRQEPVGQ